MDRDSWLRYIVCRMRLGVSSCEGGVRAKTKSLPAQTDFAPPREEELVFLQKDEVLVIADIRKH